MDLDVTRYGPWALIAGASEGIGVSLAQCLAAAGLNLVLIARQQRLLDSLAVDVRTAHGVQVRVLALDLAQPDVLERVRAATDDVDVGLLVFNAGASCGAGPFLDAPLEAVQRMARMGPLAQATLAHHFGNRMRSRGRGGLVFMGSLAGNAGSPYVVGYGACKAFSQLFAEGLWAELEPLGIDVLYTVLGATDTPARRRTGIKDPPGAIVDAPDAIARWALANLRNGPVIAPDHMAQAFRHFSGMPRREAVIAMRELLRSYQQ